MRDSNRISQATATSQKQGATAHALVVEFHDKLLQVFEGKFFQSSCERSAILKSAATERTGGLVDPVYSEHSSIHDLRIIMAYTHIELTHCVGCYLAVRSTVIEKGGPYLAAVPAKVP